MIMILMMMVLTGDSAGAAGVVDDDDLDDDDAVGGGDLTMMMMQPILGSTCGCEVLAAVARPSAFVHSSHAALQLLVVSHMQGRRSQRRQISRRAAGSRRRAAGPGSRRAAGPESRSLFRICGRRKRGR